MSQPIQIYKNENAELKLTIYKKGCEPRDLSGDVEVWFYVSDQLPANTIYIEKQGEVIEPLDGKVKVDLTNLETDISSGLYYYSVIVKYPINTEFEEYVGGIGRLLVRKRI